MNTNPGKLTFYIIYVPNTVRLLHFFVWSLLKHSDCYFNLVANGCDEDEKRLLQTLCSQDQRLTYIELPTKAVWSHGATLNYLQQREEGDYFCFMDSDILATGRFMQQFEPLMGQFSATMSCSLLWLNEQDKVCPSEGVRATGRCHWTDNGLCLGSSFFAIYNNRRIRNMSKPPPIDLRTFNWQKMDASMQEELKRMGAQYEFYDTGKMLNLMLQSRGEQIYFAEAEHLLHLGSISAKMVEGDFLKRKLLAKWLHRLPDSQWKLRWLNKAAIDKEIPLGLRTPADRRIAAAKVHRSLVSRYFSEFLSALVDHKRLPKLPLLNDRTVWAKMEEITHEVIELHREFGMRRV